MIWMVVSVNFLNCNHFSNILLSEETVDERCDEGQLPHHGFDHGKFSFILFDLI